MVLTVEQRDEQKIAHLARIQMAMMAFRDFLPFVKVEQPGTGMVPFEMWDYVVEEVGDLETQRLLVIAKSRQIGQSTLLAAYALWHAMFVPLGLVLIISKGEREAHKFLKKCKDIYAHLPPALKRKRGLPDNLEEMTFANGGSISAFPSTADAGRSLSPTLAIMDEADYHEYIDEAYLSIKPGLDTYDGQMILTSTISAYKMGSLFQNTWLNAPDNNFTKRFYGWRVRPGRDDAWYAERKTEYQDQALFQKEFPENWEEAFAPASAIAAFNNKVIMAMKRDVRDPIETPTMGNGVMVNIYQEFQSGTRYSAATDTSHGVGKDYSVTAICNVVTGYTVADIMSNVISETDLALASIELLQMYDSPIWGIEDNDWGVVVLRKAQELRYKRIYWRDDDHIGWHTYYSPGMTEGSRSALFADLITMINSRFFTIPNAAGLAQFLTMIRNPKKDGRIEAQEGANDDYPMVLGILWQIRKLAHLSAGERGKGLDFANSPSQRKTGRWIW